MAAQEHFLHGVDDGLRFLQAANVPAPLRGGFGGTKIINKAGKVLARYTHPVAGIVKRKCILIPSAKNIETCGGVRRGRPNLALKVALNLRQQPRPTDSGTTTKT